MSPTTPLKGIRFQSNTLSSHGLSRRPMSYSIRSIRRPQGSEGITISNIIEKKKEEDLTCRYTMADFASFDQDPEKFRLMTLLGGKNPLTGRRISTNGVTFKKLLKVFKRENVEMGQITLGRQAELHGTK
ncbi:hypothetical protein GEMRC1_006289 [Eukaryota sp. GEM-RC1]